MRLIESFKKKKLILLNIFLTLYIGINLIGGERGLISYIEKKKTYEDLVKEEIILKDKIGRIRDIEINKKGDIFLLSDEYNSGLWKITK